MTVQILLIRHASHDDLGSRLTGRRPGIPLNTAGREAAHRLGGRLADTTIASLVSSPTHRTLETAAIIGRRVGIPVRTAAALDEIDFGEWTGKTYAQLDSDRRWQEWNAEREVGVAAGGESMASVRGRLHQLLERMRQRFRDRTVVAVTHCDIIRTIIADILGLSLNAVHRFDIDPASVSRVVTGAWGSKVVSMNEATG